MEKTPAVILKKGRKKKCWRIFSRKTLTNAKPGPKHAEKGKEGKEKEKRRVRAEHGMQVREEAMTEKVAS